MNQSKEYTHNTNTFTEHSLTHNCMSRVKSKRETQKNIHIHATVTKEQYEGEKV